MRNDDVAILALTLKFPWYFEEKVIGVFGFSIVESMMSMTDFVQIMPQLISAGLLSDESILNKNNFSDAKINLNILTARENEVLKYFLRGKTAKEIAIILNISYKTVQLHIAKIRFKTKCKSRSELFERFY